VIDILEARSRSIPHGKSRRSFPDVSLAAKHFVAGLSADKSSRLA